MLKIRVQSETTQLDVELNQEQQLNEAQLAATVAKLLFAKLTLSRLGGARLLPANKPLVISIGNDSQFIRVVESFKVNRFDSSLQSRLGKAIYYNLKFNGIIRQLEGGVLPELQLTSKELDILKAIEA